MYEVFSANGGTLLVLAIALAIVTLGAMYFLTREPSKKSDTYRFVSAPDKTTQTKLAMIAPGEPVAALKLRGSSVIPGKVAHLGVVTGFSHGGKIVMRKPNGELVRRSARRVEALANTN